MKTTLHRADTRGVAEHGWLSSRHTFSFAGYHDPSRMHFGALRVLNDDRVAPGMGFGRHPHDNMEIISIPLEGDLEHSDTLGNVAVIRKGDVQVMSAGTGIQHSEKNKNHDREVRFLQIWVFPNKRNVQPRYGQVTLEANERRNRFQRIISPGADDAGLWIHQNAWFHLGTFDKDASARYTLQDKASGVYAFVIKGSMTINGVELHERDGLGMEEVEEVEVLANSTDAELLLMEVPMTL